jgi:hypothetical protein
VTAAEEGPGSKPEESGFSIGREGPAAAFLRHRIERPARIGLYVLTAFGAFTAIVSAALWILSPSDLALGLVILGGVLILLGYVQFVLYRRDEAHWPDQVMLWDGGIELVLHNGEVRGVSWTDPDFALDLVARKAPAPAGREFLLVWMSEGKIPSAEITEEGFEKVQRAAVAGALNVMNNRRGRSADATQTVEIRQNTARKLLAAEARSKAKADASGQD